MYCTAEASGSSIAVGVTPNSVRSAVFDWLSSLNMPAPAVATKVPPAATHLASAADAASGTCVSAR